MKYLDSNILICAVLYQDARALACRRLLEGVAAGVFRAATSVLSWDEFSYVLERHVGREVAVAHGERLLRYPGVEWVACTPALLAAAQELRQTCRLRPRDCLHAATARHVGAACIVSLDADFDAVRGLTRECPT